MWSTLFCLMMVAVTAIDAVAPPPVEDFDITLLHNVNISAFDGQASFRYIYVTHNTQVWDQRPSQPSILIAATGSVSDKAMYIAARTVALMVKHMPNDVFAGVTRSHGVGVFAKSEGPMVYPEMYRLRDRPECRGTCSGNCANTCTADGRKWKYTFGITNSRSVCLEDIILCNNVDPYRHRENIVVHEFGHLVHFYMPRIWQSKIENAYQNAYSRRLWVLGTYGMVNSAEFFATATEAFFMTIQRTDLTGGLNMCGTSQPCPSEMASRQYLSRHDPLVFEVLSYAYTNNRPTLAGNISPCMR